MPQEHRGAGRRFGDIHHRHIEQFLQAFTAMFAIAGLDHRIKGLVVGHYPIHHGDGCQITFKVAFHRFCAEVRGEPDNLGAR